MPSKVSSLTKLQSRDGVVGNCLANDVFIVIQCWRSLPSLTAKHLMHARLNMYKIGCQTEHTAEFSDSAVLVTHHTIALCNMQAILVHVIVETSCHDDR